MRVAFVLLILSMITPSLPYASACGADPGIWAEYRKSLHDHLEYWHHGVALESGWYEGTLWTTSDYELEIGDSRSVRMSYSDSAFSILGLHDEVLLSIELESEIEIFSVDLGEGLPYVEWRFFGSILCGDKNLESILGGTATVIIQGRQNRCFDPDRMDRWIIDFKGDENPSSQQAAYGTVVMDRAAWEEVLYKRQ